MPDRADDFLKALDARRAATLDACTRCGKCVEVCPMPGPAGLDVADPQSMVTGVIDIIRTGAGPEDSLRWANVCTGSGHCIQACPEGINPRFMLALARIASRKTRGAEAVRQSGSEVFRGMSRGVRVLSRLQLPPDLLLKLAQLRRAESGEPDGPPDIVFYTGCNVLKTPHIALLCLDVMDALGVTYEVHGGPSYCCGVYQFSAGDERGFARMSTNTVERFADSGAGRVLSWCPSCQVHLGDAALGTYAHMDSGAPFDLEPFVRYLESRLDDLRPLMTHRVEKRVGLHEHPGVPGITEAARAILEAIPGLEFVDLAQPRLGYMCNTLNTLPEYKKEVHFDQLAAAEAAGVTALAGVYHACHRELCSHERDWPFEVVNFMELVGESMGLRRPDLFKRLKIMQDVDAVVAESRDLIADYGLDLDEVRAVVQTAMLGEQPLPLGRR
jgi:heterodisulfide reductase subunit D